MQWFGERPRKREIGQQTDLLRAALGPSEAATETDAERPPLMMLVVDGSAPLARRVHSLPNPFKAARFIEAWYSENKADVILFWPVAGEPGAHQIYEWDAELLVMVRDDARPGVVYAFSFHDMDSARLFIRDEARRGLDLRRVIMVWAVPVQIETDGLGRAQLFPEAPPAYLAARQSSLLGLAAANEAALQLEP